jgi:homoserine acetyltransferase
MDWFDITDGYPDLPSALADISLKTACVLGVETDLLFPAYQQKEIADALFDNGVDTSFTNLESLMGHDAFLVDYDHFNPHIVAYFSRIWVEDGLVF